MSTDPSTRRLLARFLLLPLANRVRELFGDLAVRLRGGRGLRSGQRLFLLRDFRLELESAVEDAENHAISDEEADRISLIRSLIRWLEGGEVPGPAAILFLEEQLGGIGRHPDDHEVIERAALVAAIHGLGGNGRAAAGIWRKPDPELLRGFGRTLHRHMRRAGLTVAEIAEQADLQPSEVVAYLLRDRGGEARGDRRAGRRGRGAGRGSPGRGDARRRRAAGARCGTERRVGRRRRGRSAMTGREKASVGSTLLGVWSRRCGLVGWSRSLGGGSAARCGGRPAGLSPATRDRVIDLIEGDLDCLIEDASVKPVAGQSVEEMLFNREVLVWLRGGPLPGQGAVELLEENVAVFYRAPAEDEQANGKALRAALDELVRARAAARSAGPCEGDTEAAGPTDRERRRFGRRLDELRVGKNMTIGELSARSGIDVVSIVALIHGADEAGALEMMSLAAALEALPRDLFPGCPAGAEDEEGQEGPGGDA